MARHIVCVLDRTVGHVSICWDYVSIFIYKNSNYNKINQICDSGTGNHCKEYFMLLINLLCVTYTVLVFFQELTAVVGKASAQHIYRYFNEPP